MLTAEEVADAVEAVQRRRAARALADEVERTQAFPGSRIPVIGCNGNAIECSQLSWGFAPEWSAKPIFNTRIEKAASGSGMWDRPFKEGRCVIPAAAFFEPHKTETMSSPRTGKPMKRPYVFESPDGLPLMMAGLQEDGYCSVITTEPNRWVASVHDRMPLLLRFEEIGAWLGFDGNYGEALGGDGLARLADRSVFELAARPEFANAHDSSNGSASAQLALF